MFPYGILPGESYSGIHALADLSVCVNKYQQHAIAGCIEDSSGTCHLLIAQHGHLWFLHVSGSFWTTCRDPVVPHVSFLLAHVLCYSWVTCHFFIGPSVVFFIGPRGMTTIPHMSFFYSTTCLDAICPRVSILFGHVSCPKLPTFLF